MRRLCLFTGGFAAAAGLYLFLLHGAPGVLLAALAAVCALLFLLRRPILRRAAVCVLGLPQLDGSGKSAMKGLPGAVGTRRFFCARLQTFPAKQPRFPRRRWPRRGKAATGSPSPPG